VQGFVVSPKSVHVDRIVGNAAGTRIRLTAEEATAIDGLSSQGGWRRIVRSFG
jgi:diketogulonate reductase-like aldo/keto reductase